MAKGILAFPNRADAAALSGGNWQIGLEAVQDQVLARVARAASCDPSATVIDVEMDRADAVRIVVVCSHTMDLDGRWRVTGYGDAGRTDLLYDSGDLAAFPRIFSWRDLRWGERNFWGGKVLVEDIDLYPRNAIHILPTHRRFRWWRISLSNPTNARGYLDVGRVYMAPGWVPQWNFTLGAGLSHETDTLVDQALDGHEEYDRREPRRVVTISFDNMDLVEGVNQAMALQRRAGLDRDLFFCWDPANPLLLQQRSFLGNLRSLSSLDFPFVGMTTMSFEIKEVAWRAPK